MKGGQSLGKLAGVEKKKKKKQKDLNEEDVQVEIDPGTGEKKIKVRRRRLISTRLLFQYSFAQRSLQTPCISLSLSRQRVFR